MLTTLKKFYYYIRQACYINKIDTNHKFKQARLKATIIRLTHAIEKGLCINKPRLGYGKEKIQTIMNNTEYLIKNDKNYLNSTVFFMSYDALSEYLEWHRKQNYSDSNLEVIKKFIDKVNPSSHHTKKYGGTIIYKRKPVDIQNIENLFDNRHSIRAFLDKEINKDDLIKAIKLANKYPSACNRQAVRLYVVNHKKTDCVEHWFTKKQGFWNDVKDFIMVCAKVSSYVPDEYQQYEVSAGIYAGFLTLALQTYGIGSCIIQREVLSTSQWRKFASSLEIPYDEQLICLVACGYQDESIKVPLSHRFSVDEMTRFIE